MKTYSTLLKRTSGSVSLKDVSQAKTISLLFPEYNLVWEPPIDANKLLLLDTSFSPLQFRGDFSWLRGVERIEVLPGLKRAFDRTFAWDSSEVEL
jgi:hypothetical protein